MRQFESTITLAASPTVVWRHMADVVHWPDWMPTFDSIEPLEGVELALRRRFKVEQPRLRTAIWSVTRLEPAFGFTWESRMPGLLMLADHNIESCAAGSSVHLRFAFGGPLGAVLAALYGGLVRRYLQLECAAYQRRLTAISPSG